MHLSRRDFLKAAGVTGAAALVPWRLAWASNLSAADLTTLNQTIIKGSLMSTGAKGSYFRLASGPGEPHMLRDELAAPRPGHKRQIGDERRSVLSFGHFTDIHLVDGQSPARVEFLDRFNDTDGCDSAPFASAHRPQEMLTLHILEAMIRQIRAIKTSPVSDDPISFTVCTGDNIDNEQLNELRWFIDTMDGGKLVTVNSGGPDYEGVQAASWADPEYWHPDPAVDDKYKQQWGFPDYPGLFEKALQPFEATGVGMPWYQTFGNHDGLLQGNAPRNPFFEAVAVGGEKMMGLPPGVNPCDSFQTLRDNPAAFAAAPVRIVERDAQRKIVTRREYIDEMFKTTGRPAGHGFTPDNKVAGLAYWSNEDHDGFRLIGLDTVNPGGYADGSIGAGQLAWLEQRLIEVSSRYFDASGEEKTTDNEDRLVLLFSHHGLRSLDNPLTMAPDPLEPASNDLPRVLADEVEALVHRFPNVVAWVNGHSHVNIIEPRLDPSQRTGGFWDIGTAAHIDWGSQSRLLDVVDNRDGTLSIFCTMVDHAGPVTPGVSDPVLDLASISRELGANDYQSGFASNGRGGIEDRNVELLIAAPFKLKAKGKSPTRVGALAI